MKNRKVLCILLSLALLLGMTVPGTLALSADTATADSTDSTTTTQATTSTASETIESDATAEDSDVVSTVDETADTIAPDGSVEITEIGEPCEECGQVGGHTETCSRNTPVCNCEATEEEKADPNFIHKEGCPLYVVPESTENDLYTRLMAATTPEEFLSIVNGLSAEEAAAFEKSLSGEQIQALRAHLQEISPAVDPVPSKTVVFTAAGPFMPPVNVSASKWSLRRAIASSGVTADNGLEISKEVLRANDDGSYTIRLEAYTTGTVVTSTKTVPVDIVLVLDQSGSMAYDFKGNSTSINIARRQYAMKQAVNNFISSVGEKYSEEADHRISIVTFGSNATTLQRWTFVDGSGVNTLQTKIGNLPDSPSGATNVAAGMTQAENLMGTGYSYSGSNRERQKVVIVFTDGVPTTQSDFDTTVASNAISSAKNLKDGGSTVYTVGIFNGANPSELHGEKWDYTFYSDIPCSGDVDSYWGGSWFSSLVGSNDFEGIDIAAGNRFLNYLSSNCPDSTSIGLERGLFNPGGHRGADGTGYRITQNFNKTNSDYYLTANDSSSLNQIFKTISDNIQTANINLGSETQIVDTVSDYFVIPEGTSDIKIYTAAAKADGSFEVAVSAPESVVATTTSGSVSVTGFDFNANFVSDKVKEDGTYGKKLIIEFNITPKDGFVGGNDVPTNDWEKSAVYDKDGKEIEKFADEVTTPTVNVPIKAPEFVTSEKTIYQGNSTSVAGLYSVPDTTGWQYDYVYVNVVVGGVEGELASPSDCTDYTVTVTYTPKTEGKDSEGAPNAMEGVSNSDTVAVHVLKPAVTATINDVQKYYGESYTLGDGANGSVSAEWKDANGHTGIPAAEGTSPYTGDNLTLDYSTSEFTGNTGSVPKHDFDVTVKVMYGSQEITDATITTTCAVAGSSCQLKTNGVYTVHVKTCALTITKSGGAAGEPYVFKVMKDNVEYTQVTIVGNNSVTICELPVGTYTIEEDTGWSWRYAPTFTPDVVTLSKDATSATIICTNEQKNPYWLNGFSDVVKNIFGVTNK